ncbi:TRAP transporter substrate-binding protein [Virgibacillus ainsalahensis]
MIYKQRHTKFSLLIVTLIGLVLLSACAESAVVNTTDTGEDKDSYTFRLSHVVQESHVWHATAEKFGEELEALSDGRMSLEIYPAAQLGKEQDMVHQMNEGSIDFGILTNGYMSTRVESLNAWYMPFLFSDLQEAVNMKDSEEAEQMLDSLESQGLVGLDFIFAGNRHVLLDDRFIDKPEDMDGKKIRILGSPSLQGFWQKTPAGPTAMPLSEVYTSLQTGIIDGIAIDLDALATEKHYENAEYLTLTNHATFPAVIVMSKVVEDSLTEEDQQIVRKAMDSAVEWSSQEAIEREETNLQLLRDEGVKVKELENLEAFDPYTNAVRKEFSERSEIIKSFIESAEQQ